MEMIANLKAASFPWIAGENAANSETSRVSISTIAIAAASLLGRANAASSRRWAEVREIATFWGAGNQAGQAF